MIHKVVGIKQNGFLVARSTFDNIIDVQEIDHSLEFDAKNLPRMLLKIDIEKAYGILEWNAILATLTIMKFPENGYLG